MNYMNEVDKVESPHITEIFRVEASKDRGSIDTRVFNLCTTVRFYLDNILCKAIQQSVNEHKNKKDICITELSKLDLKNKVVYTCPYGISFLVDNKTYGHAKYIVSTHHVEMNNRLIILDLKDNEQEYLCDYSGTTIPKEELGDDFDGGLTVEAQFYVASTAGTDYTFTNPEKQED